MSLMSLRFAQEIVNRISIVTRKVNLKQHFGGNSL